MKWVKKKEEKRYILPGAGKIRGVLFGCSVVVGHCREVSRFPRLRRAGRLPSGSSAAAGDG